MLKSVGAGHDGGGGVSEDVWKGVRVEAESVLGQPGERSLELAVDAGCGAAEIEEAKSGGLGAGATDETSLAELELVEEVIEGGKGEVELSLNDSTLDEESSVGAREDEGSDGLREEEESGLSKAGREERSGGVDGWNEEPDVETEGSEDGVLVNVAMMQNSNDEAVANGVDGETRTQWIVQRPTEADGSSDVAMSACKDGKLGSVREAGSGWIGQRP